MEKLTINNCKNILTSFQSHTQLRKMGQAPNPIFNVNYTTERMSHATAKRKTNSITHWTPTT